MKAKYIAALLGIIMCGDAGAQSSPQLPEVKPEWQRKPSVNEMRAVYPLKATEDGRVVLRCEVSEKGILDFCKIVEEEPAGQGFGQAALLLKESFLMKPAMLDGKPVRSVVMVPVSYKGFGDAGFMDDTSGVRMVTEATWSKTPTWEQVIEANPTRLSATPVGGRVVLRCAFARDGALRNCIAIAPEPRGRGFDAAAKSLSRHFQLLDDPTFRDGMRGAQINFAITFPDPAQATAERYIRQPQWRRAIDSQTVQELFPARATQAGVKSGRSVVDCLVLGDGKLGECKIVSEEPVGLDFGISALAVANVLEANLWTSAGEPAAGARIRLPIVLNLAEAPPPAN